MILASLQRTELKHYFAIKTDLLAAVRDAVPSDIAHHIDELEILAMHTESTRLARACAATLADHRNPVKLAVAHA